MCMSIFYKICCTQDLLDVNSCLYCQVHDEVILEGPTKSAEEAKSLVVKCMSYPFNGDNILSVGLSVDAKCALNWYEGK